ncbi:hypothetical protein TcWFU_000266 [Taenia crassiceps]|uniref:Fibronectin type-III domain-containing protein n=1 Tax=Taenia crassiceps TaxID=6207 RepID=A0ABR4QJC0_9CEST
MRKRHGYKPYHLLTLIVFTILPDFLPGALPRGISATNNGTPFIDLAQLSGVGSTKSLAVKAKRHADKRSSPLSPTNPVVYPTSFGALNISWDPPMSASLISHYEVVLQNLTHSDDVRRRVCPWYKGVTPEPGVITRLVEPSQHPALHLTNMLPDTFYSVEVCARLHNGSCSAPAHLPSSPLVPAAPPSGYPSHIRVRVLSGQSAQISWRLPDDIECNGKLMGFIMEVNSTYDTSQLITIASGANDHSLTGMMPGTDYTLRMLASTRGGQGRWSPPVSFRTQGKARVIDMEAFVTTVPPSLPLPPLPPILQPQEGDLDGALEGDLEATAQPVYFVPDKIMDFRGQGLINAIHLSWTIKWRRYRMGSSFEPQSNTIWDDEVGMEAVDSLQIAPNVMLRLIWSAGNAETAENMITAAFTSYTLENLRAGTPHHFRLIAIIPGEGGPSAYTVATPKYRNKGSSFAKEIHETSRRHPIPVNLLAHGITPTEATVQWELPREFQKSNYRDILGYQVRYYPTKRHDPGESMLMPLAVVPVSPLLVNISNPETTGVVLHNLEPGTVYEFAVRVVSLFNGAPEAADAWSMVQGFETPGQRPESPPQNITVSAVMTGYLTPLDSMGSNGGSSGGASILVSWQGVAAVGARGLYHLYISPVDEFGAQRTREWSQQRSPRRQWSEHVVPGGQNSTVLHNLRTSQPYLLVMSAQNRFGRSPLSSLCLFRTADVDGSGFIYLNTLGERYELQTMTPERIRRLSEELKVILKTLRSSNAARTAAPTVSDRSVDNRQSQWILVAAVLAVVAIIIIILVVTIILTRRFSRSRLDRVRKEYLAEATKRISEKEDVTSLRPQTSHNNHHTTSPSCSEAGFAHRVGGSGLESLMHVPPPLPPGSFENSAGFSPYVGLPFVMGSGFGVSGGGCSVASSSVHSQPVLVHANAPTPSAGGVAGRGGSESDCRTTPIDSDLESAKSANLVTAFSYHQGYHQHPPHQDLSPARQHGTTSPPVIGTAATERHLALGHAGLIASPDMRSVGNEGKQGGCYRKYHSHQSVPLPPKMEDLFGSPNKSPVRPLVLPYRELGRLETAGVVGATGSSESAEASRSTAGSSGYDSGAPTSNQPAGASDKVLTESFMVGQQPRLDTHSTNGGTLPRKFISPATPTSESEQSRSEEMRYQNHASIKLNSYSNVLPIPRISALDERSLSKVYSSEELTEEMANLEGLMKNLTAITQNDFDCTSEM